MYTSKNIWFPSTINQIAEHPTTICIMRRLLCIVLQYQNNARDIVYRFVTFKNRKRKNITATRQTELQLRI